MRARVSIRLRPDVLDPQGKAIGQALVTLGFLGVNNVRQGKLIELDVSFRCQAVPNSKYRRCAKNYSQTQ